MTTRRAAGLDPSISSGGNREDALDGRPDAAARRDLATARPGYPAAVGGYARPATRRL